MNSGEYSLRWNKFDDNLVSNVCAFYERRIFTDVTLACDGKHFKAHKLVLAACSPYFEKIFKDHPTDHPIIYLNDVTADYMEKVMEFIYKGTTHLAAFKMKPFLELADDLKLKGLSEYPVSEQHSPALRGSRSRPEQDAAGPSRVLTHIQTPLFGEPYLSELEDETNIPESTGVIDQSSGEQLSDLRPLMKVSLRSTESEPNDNFKNNEYRNNAAIDLKRRNRRNAIDCVEALMEIGTNSSSEDSYLPISPSASLIQSRHRCLKPSKRLKTSQFSSSEKHRCNEFEQAMSYVETSSAVLARFTGYDHHVGSSVFDKQLPSKSDPVDVRPIFPSDIRIQPNDVQRIAPGHMEIPAVAPGEKWFQGRLQFMLSQRGKPLLVHDGHSFGIQYIRKDKKYWQCNLSRKYNCKARVTTTDTGDIIVTNNEHCHTEIRQHLRKDYKTMKLAASLAASRATLAVSVALPIQSTATVECSSTTSATSSTLTTNY